MSARDQLPVPEEHDSVRAVSQLRERPAGAAGLEPLKIAAPKAPDGVATTPSPRIVTLSASIATTYVPASGPAPLGPLAPQLTLSPPGRATVELIRQGSISLAGAGLR